jgi:uncharacterized protein (DUF305 family)
MNGTLVASVILVAFLSGMGAGYYFSPEYARGATGGGMEENGAGYDRLGDLKYINGMIAHHESALLLARSAGQESKRPQVTGLAETIIDADTRGIAGLYDLKKRLYGDTRRVPPPVFANLGNFDERFDLRFLNAMIAHHEEAIAMAGDIRKQSFNNEILGIADEVATGLTEGIAELKSWRREWYGIE